MRGDFVLSSGRRSAYYLDARLVTLSSEGSPLVGAVFLDALPISGVDAVAGLTLGADPIVTSIAVTAGLSGRSIDGLIVRKAAKEHGTARRLEGPWRSGLRVAIVDDSLTTGASSLEAARAVEEAGGRVVGVYALIDREEGAGAAVAAAGYPFHAIYRANDLLGE
jgi:orotate phosphoribosyltransferase